MRDPLGPITYPRQRFLSRIDRSHARPTLGPISYPCQRFLSRKSPRSPAPDTTVACPPSPVLPLPLFFLFFPFSGKGPRRAQRRVMSSSASGSQRSWPRYGAVPMTRCPVCPRPEPLKRMTCAKSEIGNVGREFVKCQSKTHLGNDGKVGFVLICLDLE